MNSLISHLSSKFNENFWSSHFNSQSKCVIDDKKIIPINQKGGGDFVKVISPLNSTGLSQSDSIVSRKRKSKSKIKKKPVKKRKLSNESKKKTTKSKKITTARKKTVKGKKKK